MTDTRMTVLASLSTTTPRDVLDIAQRSGLHAVPLIVRVLSELAADGYVTSWPNGGQVVYLRTTLDAAPDAPAPVPDRRTASARQVRAALFDVPDKSMTVGDLRRTLLAVPEQDAPLTRRALQTAIRTASAPVPEFFAGDWLLAVHGADPRWSKAYAGLRTHENSGGTGWRCTREVAAQVAADQLAQSVAVGGADIDLLFFDPVDPGVLVHISTVDNLVDRIQPDDDGMYEMPCWTWYAVEAEQVDTLVTPSAPVSLEKR